MEKNGENTLRKIIKAAEELDWKVEHSFKNNIRTVGLEFSQFSPAGQDFSFYYEANSPDEMIKEILNYYEGFDTEEHVVMLIEAMKNGLSGIPSIRELVKDAKTPFLPIHPSPAFTAPNLYEKGADSSSSSVCDALGI